MAYVAALLIVRSRFKASQIGLLPIGNPPATSALRAFLFSIVVANWTNLAAANHHFAQREEACTAAEPTLDPAGPVTCRTGVAARSDVLNVALRG